MNRQPIYTVGITGASGATYGVRIIQSMLEANHRVHVVISEAGWQVFEQELALDTTDRNLCLQSLFSDYGEGWSYHTLQDFSAPIASGSYKNDGMIIAPCSMGTLSKLAQGTSSNLLERTADVMLKEKRPLIIVPRETPLNEIHLENMAKLSRVGAQVVPAMPGFYQRPETLDDLVDFVVGKVLDQLNVNHHLFKRWGD
ncbi:UbiX family flavin prenyltransferase [Texcoconibacillus texcoconensis]|uniref:Flavin prenyltransferase UbiX n=1 Tax=Texcoconibacillus texcoconensis TaxID=1095777 RepID=A0A840QNE1_9BACI|nr:flavin prenyltransferase UbiX [Texcoconibacillus texcoconensis]MBB5172894.1 4-hydroxy-3-polyprenylbenzoate decarboxylase [Texcoconibacillus texcoconensis]